MPRIPIIPVALVASLGALYYVDTKYKADMELVEGESIEEKAEREKCLAMKKKIRLGLMVFSVGLVLLRVLNMVTASKKKSSFQNRVAHAANSLRSSMDFEKDDDNFSQRVTIAAAKLRKQITSSMDHHPTSSPPKPKAKPQSALAARASAQISSFIAANSSPRCLK